MFKDAAFVNVYHIDIAFLVYLVHHFFFLSLVGHSYVVYGPLLHGCTTIMYEGKPVGTPDEGAFGA